MPGNCTVARFLVTNLEEVTLSANFIHKIMQLKCCIISTMPLSVDGEQL